MPVFKLFANTGIQFINTGMKADAPKTWSRLKQSNGKPVPWLYCRAVDGYRILAVDTQTGPGELGYFAQDEARINDPAITFTSIEGDELDDPLSISIQPQMLGGDPIDVALVLDFGNSRSLGLFVEQDPQATDLLLVTQPFRLYSHARWGLDQFSQGEPPDLVEYVLSAPPYEEVFDSAFELVYDQIPRVHVRVFGPVLGPHPGPRAGHGWLKKLFGRGASDPPAPPPAAGDMGKVTKDSGLFPDFSHMRLGSEAGDFRVRVSPTEGILTGMSSPKRYLWASRRIFGFWHHILAVPRIESAGPVTVEQLHGPIFSYIYEDDRDWLPDKLPIEDGPFAPPPRPVRPQYPCRVMMTLGLYEILAQAFWQINSIAYREANEYPDRARRLTHLVLSFPTGMCAHERGRYKTQATKAVRIFSHLWGRRQLRAPIDIRMSIDDGTACQLAYVYGEVQKHGSVEGWIKSVRQPGSAAGAGSARLASLDIGGGAMNLSVADYSGSTDPTGGHPALCEIVHLDGMGKGGDDLIKHVLERILIPQLANELGVGKALVRAHFEAAPDPVFHSGARVRRRVANVWVPLAHRYLASAERENEEDVFTMGDACPDPAALDQLWEEMKSQGWDCPHPGAARFAFRREEFDRVVSATLGGALDRYAAAVASLGCDALILAGRPSRLPAIQRLLGSHLSIPIIPLDRHEIGPWYPFQDQASPGRVADPKSAVVVGAAIEFLSSVGSLPGGVRFEVKRSEKLRQSFYWGIPTGAEPHFRNEDALFRPAPVGAQLDASADTEETASFVAIGLETIIARRLTDDESAEVPPVYCVSIRSAREISRTTITLKRSRTQTGEECLELVGAEGTVDGRPAEIKRNVFLELRTLFEERYFLDTGHFSGIDYGAIAAD